MRTRSHPQPSRRRTSGRPVVQLLALLGWLLLVAVVALVVVYPMVSGAWAGATAQVVVYAVQVLPVLLLRPRIALPLGLGPRTAVLGVALLAAAVVWAGAVEHDTVARGLVHAARAVSAGIGEEIVFRGGVFVLLRELLARPVPRVVVNAVLFAAFHLPVVLLHGDPVLLVVALLLGAVLTVLRTTSGGLFLPIALHVAVDLSS